MTADDVCAALAAAGVSLGPPHRMTDEGGSLTYRRIVHPVLSGRFSVSEWPDAPPSWSLLIRTPHDDTPTRIGWAPVNIWGGDIRIPAADAIRALTELCGALVSPAWVAECAEYAHTYRRGPILIRCAEWTWRAA